MEKNTTEMLKNTFGHELQMLDKAKPKRITFTDIGIKLSSPWLPKHAIACFLRDYVINPKENFEYKTVYNELFTDRNDKINPDAFIVDSAIGRQLTSQFMNRFHWERSSEYAIQRDGADLRNWDGIMPVLNEMLTGNRKSITMSIPIDNNRTKTVLDEVATATLRTKEDKLEKDFLDYFRQHADLMREIEDAYNTTMNRRVVKKYNGEMIKVDGLSNQYELRDYQKNAVMRIIQTGRALLAHEVGMGKTLTMLSAAFKLRDLGIANRPCITVPSALVEQFGRDALKFFPTRKVLVADKRDFTAKNRRRFYTRIMNSDFDVIIMSHEQFQRISLTPEFLESCINRQAEAYRESLEDVRVNDNLPKRTVKSIQAKLNSYETKLNIIRKDTSKYDDNFLFFEDLGIDFLFVDEAHYFKNYVPATQFDNIRGMLTNKASARAEDMLFKCQYLQSQYDNSHVVFATGTPVSNTVGEMWVMENYIQPDVLKASGNETFDKWVSTFGNIKTSMELNTTGDGYRAVNRLSDFSNLPELMAQYRTSADVRLTSQLDKSLINIPESKKIIVQSFMTPAQEDKFEELVTRSEALKTEHIDPAEDNMLKITHEARTATLDMRLIDESYTRGDSTKLMQCAENLVRIYKRTDDVKGTQIVFSDLGTPKANGKFSAYEDLKAILVEMGIPEEEIAFVHDYDSPKLKPILQDKMNSGQIRIMIGSTSKGGTGFNVQKRVKAIHHLDVPWKPSDLIQRNGRGVRNGNMFKEVEIYSYITKGSFDNYLWQIQEQKLKYITEIMTARDIMRAMHDEDEQTMTASQFKAIATGNPYMKLRMTMENEITLLSNQKRSFERSKSVMLQKQYIAKSRLQTNKKELEGVRKDIPFSEQSEAQSSLYQIEFADGQYFDKPTQAADHLRNILRDVVNELRDEDDPIAEYRGYKIYARKGDQKFNKRSMQYGPKVILELCHEGRHIIETYPISNTYWTGVGVLHRIKNIVSVNALKREEIELSVEIEKDERTLATDLNNTFDQQDKLDYSQAKLNTLIAAMSEQEHQNDSKEDDEEKTDSKESLDVIASRLSDFDEQWQKDHPDFEVSKNVVVQGESDQEVQQKFMEAVNNYNDALFETIPDDESADESDKAPKVIQAEVEDDNKPEESKDLQLDLSSTSTDDKAVDDAEKQAEISVLKPATPPAKQTEDYTKEELAHIMKNAVKLKQDEYQLSLF
ncbi:SNF2-related protein [Limosilactobacillus mucosae]|uniref:SNF2-related protein n=1 Tax=Limosilactobacillus mucosae TaxID=97478 RepID=UPI0039953C6E